MEEPAEQIGMIGLYEETLPARNMPVDGVVSCEATSLKIYCGHRGRVELNVEVSGVTSHGSTPWLGVNAVNKAMKLIDAVEKKYAVDFKTDEKLGKSSIALTIINCTPGAMCIVPDRCSITYDRRLVPSETPEDAVREIQEIIDRLSAEDPVALDGILSGTMPDVARDMIIPACNFGDMPADIEKLGGFIHAYYRLADASELEGFAEMAGGLAHKICRTARETVSYQDFFAALRNKHHTDAHLRRAILFGILGVTRDDILRAPEYTTLLASSSRGREFLSSIRKTREIEIVTKPANAPECRQTALAAKAKALFSLCLPNPKDAGYELRFSPFVGD
jgi:hypothetical protein